MVSQPGNAVWAVLFVAAITGLPGVLGAAEPAAFPVYEFPEFGLAMSAAEVRAWARDNGFVETSGVEPGQQAWRRVFANGYRQLIQFIPAESGLHQLIVTQENVVGSGRSLARQIVDRYGEPAEREDLGNGVRLTYAYEHSVPARRVFITGPSALIMGLITEVQLAAARNAAAESAAGSAAAPVVGDDAELRGLAALPGWARLAAAAGAAFAGLALLVLALPARLGRPLRGGLRNVFEALLGFLGYTTVSLFTMAMGMLVLPLFVVSGCAAGAFALEQGTSWFWSVPWLIGVVLTLRANEEGGIAPLVLANALFLVALGGPILELGLSSPTS